MPKRRVRKSSIAVAGLVFFMAFLAEPAPAAERSSPALPSGGGRGKTVVARVNGAEITMESIVMMMNNLGTIEGHEPASPKGTGDMKREALNQLILKELAYQKAKSEGLAVGRKEIDDALAEMGRNLGGAEKLKRFIEKERITEDELRKRIERNLTLKRIFAREVAGKAVVSDAEIRKEYESKKASYARPEKITVVDVVFFLEAGEAKSLEKAKETLKKIHDDKDRNPWNLSSDGTFAVRDLEIEKDREKELYEKAKTLKAGEISDVFAVSGNLRIIKLKEYSPSRQFRFEEVKRGIERKLKAKALRKRLEEWEAELRRDAKVEIMEAAGGVIE